MVDTHFHLISAYENDKLDETKLKEIIENMASLGVTNAVAMGTNFVDSVEALQIASEYKEIYCAVGIHPEDIHSFDSEKLENLIKDNINNTKLIAIGEIGLDYYWRKDNKEEQKLVFRKQIELAKKYDLPIIIHNREASGDILDILKEFAPFNRTGIIHCFSASLEWAKEVLKLGFYISFSGTVTYKNAVNVQEVAKLIPEDRLLVETDSPYLTPVPFRSLKNQPKYVVETANKIAVLRDVKYEHINKCTTENFKRLFNLEKI